MKGLTERQIKRREGILSAARKMLTKHGVDGVTMRGLAKESGVAPKTLYHQFGSKEKLLRTAVEERFRYYYRMIDEEEIAHGIERLYFIVDTEAATKKKNLQYARAMTPIVSSEPKDTFGFIRMRTYRKAIDQIATEDDFVPWINLDLLAAVVYRQLSSTVYLSRLQSVDWKLVPAISKYELSLTLYPVTRGYSQKKAGAMLKSMQKMLKGHTEIWS